MLAVVLEAADQIAGLFLSGATALVDKLGADVVRLQVNVFQGPVFVLKVWVR